MEGGFGGELYFLAPAPVGFVALCPIGSVDPSPGGIPVQPPILRHGFIL